MSDQILIIIWIVGYFIFVIPVIKFMAKWEEYDFLKFMAKWVEYDFLPKEENESATTLIGMMLTCFWPFVIFFLPLYLIFNGIKKIAFK